MRGFPLRPAAAVPAVNHSQLHVLLTSADPLLGLRFVALRSREGRQGSSLVGTGMLAIRKKQPAALGPQSPSLGPQANRTATRPVFTHWFFTHKVCNTSCGAA